MKVDHSDPIRYETNDSIPYKFRASLLLSKVEPTNSLYAYVQPTKLKPSNVKSFCHFSTFIATKLYILKSYFLFTGKIFPMPFRFFLHISKQNQARISYADAFAKLCMTAKSSFPFPLSSSPCRTTSDPRRTSESKESPPLVTDGKGRKRPPASII